MDEIDITRYIVATFADVEAAEAQGYTFFFYGAERTSCRSLPWPLPTIRTTARPSWIAHPYSA